MIEVKGKYCKDIKVFTDNIEEEALASLYRISESLAFKEFRFESILILE